jgi:hypothetical protein
MLSPHPRSCHRGLLGAAPGGKAPFACRQCGVFHMGGGLGGLDQGGTRPDVAFAGASTALGKRCMSVPISARRSWAIPGMVSSKATTMEACSYSLLQAVK